MINVTKPYLPSKEKFKKYVDDIFNSCWLTNNGRVLQTLESRLKNYLGVKNVILVNNGSLALQVAYKALGLKGDVLTTPFSFAATTSTLAWEGLKPVFVDIDPKTFAMDASLIDAAITPEASAIVPVHVFGNPCDVVAIRDIAKRHGLKVIYDAAHAFGVEYVEEGVRKSIFTYGDISTVSFHSTKLFHTIEGGAVFTNDDELAEKVRKMINFGMSSPTSIDSVGTNAKMNEFQAAMGLCVLDEIEHIVESRRCIFETYKKELHDIAEFQEWNLNSENNYAYAPVLFKSEDECLTVFDALLKTGVSPRRYFYPSLDTLDYVSPPQICPVSRDIASRILCLPLYPGLCESDVVEIVSTVKAVITR